MQKKSTGSFYTPRDIVDYMVDSSICEYLKNKTMIDEEKLNALISYNKEDDDLAVFDNEEKRKIINALYNITVLDPACGSGAFPIGMLQKIVYILQEIDPTADIWFDKATENVNYLLKKEFEKKFNAGSLNYIRKLSVIQNSIFGIDIQPIAVEISRLRCFLSLVIEEKVNDNEENRGINPLPNLDFKFIIANSLLGLAETTQMTLFENNAHINRLKSIRDEYFNADIERRLELKLEFKNVQQDMLLNTIENYQKMASTKYQQLSSWKPFENESTEWFDADWMFGIKDGFDLVIGNPPYIQLQKAISNNSKLKYGDLYQNCGYEAFARTGDIYCLFYEMGYNVLKPNGILTYITSNKWLRAGYGENLRGFLSTKSNPKILIDFAGTKVFDSATVDVNILMFNKSENSNKTRTCIFNSNSFNNMSDYIKQNSNINSFSTRDNWILINEIETSIKEKIEMYGKKLRDWELSINRGILTGYNDAFIISTETKEKLISDDPKSAELIRPILRGRDIKRYSYEFSDLWLICTFPSKKYDIEQFPAIKEHLLSFGIKRLEQTGEKHKIDNAIIKSRKRTTNKWFETQDTINYWNDFNKPKIIYPCIMSKEPSFIYDKNAEFYTIAPGNIITGIHLKYLLACLNSRIYYFALRKYYMGGGIEGELKTNRLLMLPIVLPSDNENALHLENFLINYNGNFIDIDEKINECIGKSLNLTNTEINYIKKTSI